MKKLVMVLALMLGVPAWATNYYVDGSATGCSGAPCSDSNAGTTEPLAWATPQRCISKPMVAGDTCYIKNGTYARPDSAGNDPRAVFYLGGMHGTLGNPITFRNYPGHTPLLCQGTAPSTCISAGRMVVLGNGDAAESMSYVVMQGLKLQGQLWISSGDHVTVTGNEIFGGGGYCTNGETNRSTLRVDISSYTQIDHNYLHDVVQVNCAPNQDQATVGLIQFVDDHTIFEYNTVDQASSAGFSGMSGMNDKDCPVSNTFRYNDFKSKTFTIGFQANCGASPASDVKVYGNISRAPVWGMHYVDGLHIYNNTFVNGGNLDFIDEGSGNDITNANVYNNIFHNPGNGNGYCGTCNLFFDGGEWTTRGTHLFDYNKYDSDATYEGGGTSYGTIAAWRTGFGAPRDVNSTEGNAGSSGGPCTFTDAAGGDFTIVAATACKTGACSNWPTCSTTTTEFGAYGVTSCVGAFCGVAPPDTTPPSQVTGAGATAASSTQINVTWSAATDNVGVTGYRIERCVLAGCSPTAEVGSVGAVLNFNDSGLAPSTLYRYRVRAQDAATNYGAYSSVVEATTQAGNLLVNGQVVTLSGSGFGTKSPVAPILWENFEGHTNGSALASPWLLDAAPPGVGTYSSTRDYGSGSSSAYLFLIANGGPANNYAPIGNCSSVYASFHFYIPSGGSGDHLKNVRVTAGASVYSTPRMGTTLYSPDQSFVIYNSDGGCNLDNDTENDVAFYGASENTWNRDEYWAITSSPNTANGTFQTWRNGVLKTDAVGNITTRGTCDGAYYTAIYLPYYNESGNRDVYVDNVYVDNTLSRVELCTGSTWAARSHCEIQIPTAWSTTSISLTVNAGIFGSSGTAYLYVSDSAGATNSSGFAVSLSGSSTCGNGLSEGGETCDDGNTTTESACPYGTPTCTLCDATCATVLNLTGPYCGDNILNGAEPCDTSQLNSQTCATQFCRAGTLSCTSCAFNISACGLPLRSMKRPPIGWGR